MNGNRQMHQEKIDLRTRSPFEMESDRLAMEDELL